MTMASATARPASARGNDIIWPAALIIYSLMIPQEFRLELGTIAFYPGRLAAMIALPFAIRQFGQHRIRLQAADFAIIASGLWTTVIMIYHKGGQGIEAGGGLAFNLLTAYFTARACIVTPEHFRRLMKAVLPGLALSGLSMIVESLSQRQIIRPLAVEIMGPIGSSFLDPETRIGLMRARGPFVHPILGGFFLATFVPLFLTLGPRYRKVRLLGCAAAAMGFFSLSSAPFLAYVVIFALLAYDWIQSKVEALSWPRLLYVSAALAFFLQVFSESGLIRTVIRYFTFNPATGYYRMMIWEYGTASVAAYPLFGLGLADYERPGFMQTGSIDNHWLLVAMRDGLPGAIALYVAVILVLIACIKSVGRSQGVTRTTRLGITIGLAAIIGGGFTVAFFGGFDMWLGFFLGFALSVSSPLRNAVPRPKRRTDRQDANPAPMPIGAGA